MRRYGFILIVLALMLAAPLARAQGGGAPGGSPDRGTITKVGTTSAQFLKLGVGARAIALGGSFVAEASDLSALYWNPAGPTGFLGLATNEEARRSALPKRVRFATDCSFPSSCFPPLLTETQLLSGTGRSVHA